MPLGQTQNRQACQTLLGSQNRRVDNILKPANLFVESAWVNISSQPIMQAGSPHEQQSCDKENQQQESKINLNNKNSCFASHNIELKLNLDD